MDKYTVIGALIGIVRSTDNAPSDEQTFHIIIEGLQLDDPTLNEMMYEKAMNEKFRLVPDCAVCKQPCGRTFNYDMNELVEEADEELKQAKLDLLQDLIETSYLVKSYTKELEEYFYDGLFAIGDYYDVSQFKDFKTRKQQLKI